MTIWKGLCILKKSVVLVTFVSLVVLFGGCGTKRNRDTLENSQVFNRVEAVELNTIDISLATDGYSQNLLNNTNEGLFRFGEGEKLEPAGAEKMSISDDGLTYTFDLNKKSKWSDGKAVTAQDYVYSWQRTVNPKTGSQVASLFNPIKNAEKIYTGQLSLDALGVEALSEYKLIVTLERPTPYFESMLAYPTFFPQRQDIVEKYNEEYAMTSEKNVYNGAFCLEGYKGPGITTEWTLRKNEKYRDKDMVSLSEIKTKVVKDQGTAYNLFKDGQVDETYLSGEFYQQNMKNPELREINQSNSFYIQANTGNNESIVSKKLVREAISNAINREELTKNILKNGSTASYNISPTGMAYSPKENKDFATESHVKASFNQKEAQKLWSKADFSHNSSNVELLVSDTESSKKIGEYLKEHWENDLTGLTVNVTQLPFSAVLERMQQGKYDLVLTGAKPEYPDPTSILDSLITDNAQNFSKYSNSAFDELMSEVNLKLGTDKEKRWEKMLEANDIVMEDLPIIPLLQQNKTYLRNKKIKGVQEHTLGAEFDYKLAKVVK